MQDYLNRKFKNKKILILGFGREGQSTFRILRQKFPNLKIAVADEVEKEIDDPNVEKFFGQNYLKYLDGFDIIVKSPGVSSLKKELLEAISKGVEITSQTKIFFDVVKGHVIGITGTKGKSTTASLIFEMLRGGGLDVALIGNIGNPVLDVLYSDAPNKIYVFELSSHQLFDLEKSPHDAVVTNVSVDHLDWYKNIENYIDAKTHIVKFQTDSDFAVLNWDNIITRGFSRFVKGALLYTSKEVKVHGAYVTNGNIYINLNKTPEKLGETKELKLLGRHNWDNVMQAALIACLYDVPKKVIWNTAANFKPLEHHLEFVKTIDGVDIYNDSFAVDQIATIAAVNSFDKNITLILGGYDRGIDYTEISEFLATKENVKIVILIGQIADKLSSFLKKSSYKGKIVKLGKTIMEAIVNRGIKSTQNGGILLFSPAAASFDMFKDYKDRGEQFKSAVNLLLSSSP